MKEHPEIESFKKRLLSKILILIIKNRKRKKMNQEKRKINKL